MKEDWDTSAPGAEVVLLGASCRLVVATGQSCQMTWNRQLCRGGAHLPLGGLGLVKDNESLRGQDVEEYKYRPEVSLSRLSSSIIHSRKQLVSHLLSLF